MKKILPLLLFLVIATSSFANGIEGTWTGSIQGQNGDMTLTFVFKLVDGKLTGVVKSPNGDMEITNTQVSGKAFSFDVSFGDMTIKHKCTLNSDDTINMKVEGTPMGDSEMVLKRQA